MKKSLVVDDIKGWRDFNSNVLQEIFQNNISIDTANCAEQAYNLVMENLSAPYDIIITDLQMEEDFAPKYAGEWFVEQVRTFKKYVNTKIIISSGCNNIKQIAENLSVDYIPKRVAVTDINLYKAKLLLYLKG